MALSNRHARQLWYAPLLALAMALMMLRLLVMARLLDVPAFAVFSAGLLVSGTFCTLGCFGLQLLLQRGWPVNIVRGQERRGAILALQCILVALAGAAACAALVGAGLTPAGMTRSTLAAGLLHGLAQQVFLVATVESRSRGDSVRFAWQNLARAIAALALSALVAAETGSAGAALVADAIVSGLLSAQYLRSSLARTRGSRAALWRLAARRLPALPWRSALTLMGITVVGFLLLNVDRWVASDRLAAAGFAHYSFAWIVLAAGQSAQALVNVAVFPAMARRFAQAGRGAALALCVRASLTVLAAGAIVGPLLGVALVAGIHRAYPQYEDAVALVPLFIVIAVLRVSDFWSSFLVVTGAEARLLRVNLLVAAAAAAAWGLLVAGGAGAHRPALEQVALLPALMTAAGYLAVVALCVGRR